MADKAPMKYIDIKDAAMGGLRQMAPGSLAFFLGSGIPPVPADFDRRRLPFSDVSPLLRDQRQRQSLAVPQNNPFSIFGAVDMLNRNANTFK